MTMGMHWVDWYQQKIQANVAAVLCYSDLDFST